MLVNLYKTKTPVALFGLPIMIGLMALYLFFVDVQIPRVFFTWQGEFTSFVTESRLVHVIAAFLIVYAGAVQLNSVVNNFGFYSKNTSLPGFVYALSVLSVGQFSFNMLVIGYFLLIAGLGYLFRINRQDPAGGSVFIASLFFGTATICSLFFLPMLLLPWFALIIFRSFKWREWFVVIAGFSIPWLYHYGIYFFVTGSTGIKLAGLPMGTAGFEMNWPTLSLFSFMFIMFVFGYWRYLIITGQQLLVFKKRSRILFHFVWLSIVSFVLSKLIFNISMANIVIPLSVVFSVQILYAKKSAFYNAVLYIWLAIIVVKIFF